MDGVPDDPEGEDVVVVRFEGLGAFALPISDLEAYRLPLVTEADQPAGDDPVVPVLGSSDAIPVILGEDFLRGVTEDRTRLVVDRFGGVTRSDLGPIFLRFGEEGR